MEIVEEATGMTDLAVIITSFQIKYFFFTFVFKIRFQKKEKN